MTDQVHEFVFEPFAENRRSFILLRWLLIIVCSYLVLDVGDGQWRPAVLLVIAGFFVSNLVLALLPPPTVDYARTHSVVVLLDAVFLSACFYLLRVEGPQLHVGFIVILLVGLVSANLRIIMFTLLGASMLFGAFSFFGLYGFGTEVPMADFLGLSMLFVVSIFYVFLSNRFDRDSATATVMLEERKISEVMVEMTRTLAASMNSDNIFAVVVSGLNSALPRTRFELARVNGEEVLVEASSSEDPRRGPIPLESVPHVRRAYTEKKTVAVAARGAGQLTEVVVPMITQGEVVGLIWCHGERLDLSPSGTAVHLFEVVASTAANALRNVRLLDEMKHIARTDFLTGLPNHRYFQQTLQSEMGRAQRHERPLSLLVLDLDFLKSVNDRFGHPTGDVVIRSVGGAIRAACREIDFAARYGGEEFVVILPDTDLAGAVEVGERLRIRIAGTDVGEVGQITASIGVANYPINALTAEDLVWVADQALYVAKNGGRNQVAHFKYELTNP